MICRMRGSLGGISRLRLLAAVSHLCFISIFVLLSYTVSVQAIFGISTSYHFSLIWAFVGSVMAKKIAGEDVAGAWLHIGSPCMIRLDGVFTGSWFEFSFSGWGTEMRGMMG
jgi:hypothetical protein